MQFAVCSAAVFVTTHARHCDWLLFSNAQSFCRQRSQPVTGGGGAALEQKPISAAAVQPALDRAPPFFRTQVSQPVQGKLVHWESEPLQDCWSAAGQPASGGGGG